MVVILSSWCMTASVKHELMRCPFTNTVQAPHWPWSQPFLLPVRCRCSRKASSSVVRVSSSNSQALPFTSKATFDKTAGSASFPMVSAARACASLAMGDTRAAATAAVPACRNLRRVSANSSLPSMGCSPDDVFFIGLFASTGGSVRVGDNLAHQSSALTVSLSQALLDDTLPTVITAFACDRLCFGHPPRVTAARGAELPRLRLD